MGRHDLPEEERKRVNITLDWTYRMAMKYGGTVYEKNGKRWDWGQAICREQYGPNWSHLPEGELPETPTNDDIVRMVEWEEGDIPDWVDQERTKRT